MEKNKFSRKKMKFQNSTHLCQGVKGFLANGGAGQLVHAVALQQVHVHDDLQKTKIFGEKFKNFYRSKVLLPQHCAAFRIHGQQAAIRGTGEVLQRILRVLYRREAWIKLRNERIKLQKFRFRYRNLRGIFRFRNMKMVSNSTFLDPVNPFQKKY